MTDKAKKLFEAGWAYTRYDVMAGKVYHGYEFYEEQIEVIKAALEEGKT